MTRPRIAVATLALAGIDDGHWPRLEALLSDEERARAARFRFERNRREYIAAHALKRAMLSAATGDDPRAWRFEAEAGGKPFVAGGRGPHFNLSHCEGLVACAVSADVALGVDVEPMDRRAPFEIVERNFADAEREWLLALPEAERTRGFFALWTMKEAFIKATGKGVSQGLRSFAIGFEPLTVSFPEPSRAEPGPWRLRHETIAPAHLLGLAWRGAEADVGLFEIAGEDLPQADTLREYLLDT